MSKESISDEQQQSKMMMMRAKNEEAVEDDEEGEEDDDDDDDGDNNFLTTNKTSANVSNSCKLNPPTDFLLAKMREIVQGDGSEPAIDDEESSMRDENQRAASSRTVVVVVEGGQQQQAKSSSSDSLMRNQNEDSKHDASAAQSQTKRRANSRHCCHHHHHHHGHHHHHQHHNHRRKSSARPDELMKDQDENQQAQSQSIESDPQRHHQHNRHQHRTSSNQRWCNRRHHHHSRPTDPRNDVAGSAAGTQQQNNESASTSKSSSNQSVSLSTKGSLIVQASSPMIVNPSQDRTKLIETTTSEQTTMHAQHPSHVRRHHNHHHSHHCHHHQQQDNNNNQDHHHHHQRCHHRHKKRLVSNQGQEIDDERSARTCENQTAATMPATSKLDHENDVELVESKHSPTCNHHHHHHHHHHPRSRNHHHHSHSQHHHHHHQDAHQETTNQSSKEEPISTTAGTDQTAAICKPLNGSQNHRHQHHRHRNCHHNHSHHHHHHNGQNHHHQHSKQRTSIANKQKSKTAQNEHHDQENIEESNDCSARTTLMNSRDSSTEQPATTAVAVTLKDGSSGGEILNHDKAMNIQETLKAQSSNDKDETKFTSPANQNEEDGDDETVIKMEITTAASAAGDGSSVNLNKLNSLAELAEIVPVQSNGSDPNEARQTNQEEETSPVEQQLPLVARDLNKDSASNHESDSRRKRSSLVGIVVHDQPSKQELIVESIDDAKKKNAVVVVEQMEILPNQSQTVALKQEITRAIETSNRNQMIIESTNESQTTTADRRCRLCWCCCCPCSALSKRTTAMTITRNEIKKSTKISDQSDPSAGNCLQLQNVSLNEIRDWSHSFDRLMKCPEGRKVFQDFLRCEYSEENILFWSACEELRAEKEAKNIAAKARDIYEDYISILSSREVSLDSRVRDVINQNIKRPTAHIFDEAQIQIYTLMHRDSYPRFINSPMYRKLAQLQPQPSSRKSSSANNNP